MLVPMFGGRFGLVTVGNRAGLPPSGIGPDEIAGLALFDVLEIPVLGNDPDIVPLFFSKGLQTITINIIFRFLPSEKGEMCALRCIDKNETRIYMYSFYICIPI